MDSAELRRCRGQLGLTQEQLAQVFGVTRQTVYNWERHETDGRPQTLALGKLIALALRQLAQEMEEEDGDS